MLVPQFCIHQMMEVKNFFSFLKIIKFLCQLKIIWFSVIGLTWRILPIKEVYHFTITNVFREIGDLIFLVEFSLIKSVERYRSPIPTRLATSCSRTNMEKNIFYDSLYLLERKNPESHIKNLRRCKFTWRQAPNPCVWLEKVNRQTVTIRLFLLDSGSWASSRMFRGYTTTRSGWNGPSQWLTKFWN